MHYSQYPYPSPEFYLRDGRKISQYTVDTVPTPKTWSQWFPNQPYRKLRVLVVGCGTVEAIMVAATNPDFEVVGIDPSTPSINACQKIINDEAVGNCRLVNIGIEDYRELPPFDLAIASGLLHHFHDPLPIIEHIRELLAPDGKFVPMVYGDYVRKFIPSFCEAMKALGIKADQEGVDCVRAIIASLDENHPVRGFAEACDSTDIEVADIWLHKYFRQYQASDFLQMIAQCGFAFQFWISTKSITYSVIDGLPDRFMFLKDRFHDLPPDSRYDIAQILNFNDLKLTALFAVR